MRVRRKRLLLAVLAALVATGLAFLLLRSRFAPRQVVVVSNLTSPSSLTVRAERAYFTGFVDEGRNLRALFVAPSRGGKPERLAASAMGTPSIAVDEQAVYFTSFGESSVMRVPLGGGAAAPIATGQRHPFAIAVDSGNVYFTARDLHGRAVLKVPSQGGAPEPLASGLLDVSAIAVRAGRVYVASGDSVKVYAATDGAAAELASGHGRIAALALALAGDQVVFGTSGDDATVYSVAVMGGGVRTLATRPGRLTALAVNGTRVYFATSGSEHSIYAVALDGGRVQTIARSNEPVSALAPAAGGVFFASGELDGKILRIAD